MKTVSLIPGEKVHGLPLDQIPVRASDTGISPGRLAGLLLRNGIADPIGRMIDGELVVYNDWRLRELQAREGVPVLPDPNSLTLVSMIHENHE